MKPKEEYETTTNRSVWNKRHRELHARCSWCRWHKGDNKDWCKHGTKVPRYKTSYRGTHRVIQETAA
jgi:hypothetical protein